MPTKSYLPTVRINDVEVPLSAFSFQASAADLGVKADITITDPNLDINKGDNLTLTLRTNFGTQPKSRLIKDGIVAGNSKIIASKRLVGLTAANDSFTITGIDNIGFRWKLAPRIPIILFDPQYLTIEENEADTNINDENGDRIFATVTPVGYLDLDYILEFAYVTSCGFDEVIHNLPNVPLYRIPRADFPLNASYHSIAASFYSVFKPLVFEDDNRLFIIDVFGEIPAGILSGARLVEADGYISYQKENPETAVVNAVLLSHKEVSVQTLNEDAFPPNVTFREESEPPDESGSILDGDYTRTTFKRFIVEIHDDEEDLAIITSEFTYKEETKTEAYVDGLVQEVGKTTQTDRYSNSWRLKLGYEKIVEAYVEDGSGGKFMQNVSTEVNTLTWKPSIVNPGEWEKHRSLTRIEGLVLVDGEGDEQLLIPILEASANKDIPDDGSLDIERKPISSKLEVWRYTGADQIEIHIHEYDALAKRLRKSGTVSHVGTNAVRVRNGNSFNTKQVLLIDEASDIADGAREPITFDAGFVVYAIAKELALRELAEKRTPRPRITCKLASYDAGIRRGSVRRIRDRDGNEVKSIITGYSVTGTQAQRGQNLISQSIEGVVIN